MTEFITPVTIIQNETFQGKNFLPICKVECAGRIEPDARHEITHPKLILSAHNKSVRPVSELVREGNLFVQQRAAAVEIEWDSLQSEAPPHVSEAARVCAATIVAGECPQFTVSNGSIHLRR